MVFKHQAKLHKIIFFVAIYSLLAYFFRPSLIFSATTSTGGDMGSHFYTASYASEFLLKNPSVFNWDFGWFAGYPPFIFYFPLAFFAMGILDLFMPLQIAFKLVAVSGIFLLPAAVYYLVRSFRLRSPYPQLGALLSLIFLFNNNMESSAQIWGGTIMSMLAGEFSDSLSVALGIFFLGAFYRSLNTNKKIILPAILLSLTLLAHALTFTWVVIVSLGLILPNFSKDKLWYYMKVMALTALIDSFWLIPTLVYKPYFLNLANNWPAKFKDILPTSLIFWPVFMIPAFILRKKKLFSFAFFIGISIGASLLLSLFALKMGIYAVRYYPYLQLSFVISGIFVAAFVDKKAAKIFYLLFLLGTFYFILGYRQEPVVGWLKWNFEGVEAKANFHKLKQANEFVKGIISDPRVITEFNQETNDTGTVRNNELVPLFSGRQTLEGVHLFSSITNPFIFKIQSEISTDKSCQTDVIGLKCGDIDYDLGTEHLKMFNVSHLIVRSQKIKEILQKRSDFQKLADFEPFEVWQFLSNNDGYVSIPRFQPIAYTGKEDWKKVSFDWFSRKELLDTPLIFNASKNDLESGIITTSLADLNYGLQKIETAKNCQVTEKISHNRIQFKTNCIGSPHLIKVSYFPAWGVKGASKVFFASPSFMLVYPEKEEVELKFGNGGIAKLLNKLPLISILALIALAFRKYKTA
ncbi:MAG: hypothetical protein HYT63_00515 [Candidatus Yanofskybacteria bacterium]|nr:hypothetical protein [Candidatus Yanofskybacteria bacterium]